MDENKDFKKEEHAKNRIALPYLIIATVVATVIVTWIIPSVVQRIGQAPTSIPTSTIGDEFADNQTPLENIPSSIIDSETDIEPTQNAEPTPKPTPEPPHNEVQAETRDEPAEPPEWHYFGEFRISNNAMELLKSVEGTSREIPIKDISGYEIGAEPITITLEEGQVLFISSGIYSIILPDGSPFSRGIDERAVANDYFFLQGDYLISDWERPTSVDGNVFSAIGISVFPSRVPLTRMLQPVSDAFRFNVDEDLQRQIQDGRAKEINFSRFALLGEDSEPFEIQAIRDNGFIQIELLP